MISHTWLKYASKLLENDLDEARCLVTSVA